MNQRGTVGSTDSQRAVLFDESDPLRLSSGVELRHVEVAYETYGELAPDASNAIVICHALTGDAHAAGTRGWWSNLIGPGHAVDTDRYFVVCSNLLGGCKGTTGPTSINPATDAPYGPDFPDLSMADLVSVHRKLLAHLGIQHLHAAVGGSLGGMQVLQWALDHPSEMDRAVLIAATSRLSAQNIALSSVARAAIVSDPGFADGDYLAQGTRPAIGLNVARQLAHITYVSEQYLEDRFGRRHSLAPSPDALGGSDRLTFDVENYLRHQGASFVNRFDAHTYLTFSRLMDQFDAFAEPRHFGEDAPSFLVASFDSDWRFGPAHSARITSRLRDAGAEVENHVIISPFGHDSFLLEPEGYHDLVRNFLDRRPVDERADSPRGEITLRERLGRDGQTVLELRVNGVFVMDTEETSTERALAHSAMATVVGDSVRVLVGGLGLGFTLAALQDNPRVEEIVVVEIEPAVVEWHRKGFIPEGPALLSTPGTSVVVGDVADVIRESAGFDLILLDVDNGPRYLVHEQNAPLYREEFLRAATLALAPGGALGIWAANEAPELEAAMRAVFGNAEQLSYPVQLQGREEEYLLYLSRLVSEM